MNDPRVDRLAELVVGYALGLGKGDVVRLDGFDVSAPLALALYRSALRAGAHPYSNIVPTGLNELLVAEGSDEQLAYIAPTQWHEIEELDAIVTIWSEQNTRSFSNADEQRHSAYIATQRKLSNRRWERISAGELRWCGTLHPTHAHAQDAGMSLDEYERFFHAACHTDADAPEEYWRSVAGALHSRADELAGVRELRILGPDTDLRVVRRGPHVARRRRDAQPARRRGLHEPGRDRRRRARSGSRSPRSSWATRSRTSACASRAAGSSTPRRRAASRTCASCSTSTRAPAPPGRSPSA